MSWYNMKPKLNEETGRWEAWSHYRHGAGPGPDGLLDFETEAECQAWIDDEEENAQATWEADEYDLAREAAMGDDW